MYNNSTSDKDKYIIFREKNANNLTAFKDELGKINWAEMPGLKTDLVPPTPILLLCTHTEVEHNSGQHIQLVKRGLGRT